MNGTHFQRLKHYFSTIFDTESSGRLVIFSPIVGIVAGLGAAIFFLALIWMQNLALGRVEGYYPPPAGSEDGKAVARDQVRLRNVPAV